MAVAVLMPVQIHELIATLRDALPAFFKQLRLDVSALYLSDPGIWQRIGFPGPSSPMPVPRNPRGSTVTFVGDVGQALLLKLGINISLGVQMLAFSEGVLLAEQGGVDRSVALDVLTHSAIGSPMLQARVPLLLDLPEEAWFDVGLMQKDIVLALDTARQLRVPLPSASTVDQMLTLARAAGYEHRDIAALFEVLRLTSDTTRPLT